MKLFKRPKKISVKLMMIYSLVFFVGLIFINIATYISIRLFINNNINQQLEIINQNIKIELNSNEDIDNDSFNSISEISENINIVITLNNVVVFTTGEFYQLPINLNQNIITKKLEDKTIKYIHYEERLENDIFNILIVKNMDNEMEYLSALAVIMLLIDLLMIAVSLIVGYLLSKKTLKPITIITNKAEQINVNNLTERLDLDGPDDELKRLSITFNKMIDRIQYAYDQQKQFTLNASHELATPISVIKGYIDLIDRWGKKDGEILQEGIIAIKQELTNMVKLIDALLFIAKGDNNIYPLEIKTFQINEVINEIVRETEILNNKNVHIVYQKYSCEINGDRGLIKEMLRAIINNSIKYSKENNEIIISTYQRNDKLIIKIKDYGIGIPKEDLPYIFDRFYRVDKSRSKESGGTGLGLAIVKWIVDIHMGNIEVKSKVNEGTEMNIILPVK